MSAPYICNICNVHIVLAIFLPKIIKVDKVMPKTILTVFLRHGVDFNFITKQHLSCLTKGLEAKSYKYYVPKFPEGYMGAFLLQIVSSRRSRCELGT